MNQFRFSHDKRFGRVSFREFLATASTLCQIVLESRGSATVFVLSSEDRNTYDYSKVTFSSDEITEALGYRRRYSLESLTEEVWNRSLHVEIFLKDENDPEPFMICLSCDKYGDGKRMLFYGQCLDEKTEWVVIGRFCRSSISHKVGNGLSPSGLFNTIVGAHLTGMRVG